MKPMEDDLLTIKDVAKILKVSEGHVYKLMRQGGIPVIRDGKRFTRILKSDLLAYLQRHRQDSLRDKGRGK